LAGLSSLTEACSIIDRALARAEHGGELIYVPEIFRAKGEPILMGGDPPPAAAEEWFVRAADLASRQGALLWELQATVSHSRLKVKLGRKHEARNDLSLVLTGYRRIWVSGTPSR
jgi:predicted ATPase